jgi:hypothetical protein
MDGMLLLGVSSLIYDWFDVALAMKLKCYEGHKRNENELIVGE